MCLQKLLLSRTWNGQVNISFLVRGRSYRSLDTTYTLDLRACGQWPQHKQCVIKSKQPKSNKLHSPSISHIMVLIKMRPSQYSSSSVYFCLAWGQQPVFQHHRNCVEGARMYTKLLWCDASGWKVLIFLTISNYQSKTNEEETGWPSSDFDINLCIICHMDSGLHHILCAKLFHFDRMRLVCVDNVLATVICIMHTNSCVYTSKWIPQQTRWYAFNELNL